VSAPSSAGAGGADKGARTKPPPIEISSSDEDKPDVVDLVSSDEEGTQSYEVAAPVSRESADPATANRAEARSAGALAAEGRRRYSSLKNARPEEEL
jgi:hypothetical protein